MEDIETITNTTPCVQIEITIALPQLMTVWLWLTSVEVESTTAAVVYYNSNNNNNNY